MAKRLIDVSMSDAELMARDGVVYVKLAPIIWASDECTECGKAARDICGGYGAETAPELIVCKDATNCLRSIIIRLAKKKGLL